MPDPWEIMTLRTVLRYNDSGEGGHDDDGGGDDNHRDDDDIEDY